MTVVPSAAGTPRVSALGSRAVTPSTGLLVHLQNLAPAARPSASISLMKVHVGTSGYSYKEWRGSFYPEKIKPAEMLAFYGQHFDTVEINNTFYRMPKASVLEGWCKEVPDQFQFVLKASQRITHRKKLEEVDDELAYLFEASLSLGNKRGPFLFQLPPWLRADNDKLARFLKLLPEGVQAAFEPRHESWKTDETFEILRTHNVALCNVDTEDLDAPAEIVETADWGYLRLRRCDYTDADIAAWVDRILSSSWKTAWVFFKHEDGGVGPDFARRFQAFTSEKQN